MLLQIKFKQYFKRKNTFIFYPQLPRMASELQQVEINKCKIE